MNFYHWPRAFARTETEAKNRVLYKCCSARSIHDRYKNYTEKFTAIFISQMRPRIYRTCGTRRSEAENASLTSAAIKRAAPTRKHTLHYRRTMYVWVKFFSGVANFSRKKPHKSVKYYGAIQVNVSALLRRGVFRKTDIVAWAMSWRFRWQFVLIFFLK